MENEHDSSAVAQTSELSYLQERIFNGMGLTPEQNKIELSFDMGDDYRTGNSVFDIFSDDGKGNIRILVYSLGGTAYQYIDPNEGKTHEHSSLHKLCYYYVTRIAPKNREDDDPKYRFPKGQGVFPFFPPALVKKYQAKEEIDTLVLTEGYIKAMCGSLHGLDIVGLGSITHYADSNTRNLHSDIKKLINACKVRKVVLLYDGDCTNISRKDLEKKRDLSRRPKIFYNSILNTRDLLVDFSDVKIEFAYVLSDSLADHPKGLDDLLLSTSYKDRVKEIVKDLTEDNINGAFFFRMNVKEQVQRLKKQFYIESVHSFYKHWADELRDDEFLYDRMWYHYDSAEDKVERVTPADIRNYIRVGDDYYEMIKLPNIRTDGFEVRLTPRRKSTIADDFGKDQVKNVKKYKAFINKPSHINYQPVIDDCWNLYNPLTHKEDPTCPWTHIKSLMEHIFEEQIELGYDYMQLLYLQPTQILPILCLVSQERGTGKTSFLDLLRAIYGANCVNIGNGEFSSEFNALVSGKLIVGVDETSLDDNTKIAERLKMMSTAKKMAMQRKGKDHEEVENFTKYVLCANNETRFIFTQKDETRFWVRKINPIPEADVISDILPIFHEEIPGFLAFLHSRKMYIKEPNHSRMWFSAEDIHTEALDRLKADQLPKPVKEMKDVIKQLFINFPASRYVMSIKVVKQLVSEVRGVSNDTLRTLLRDYLGVYSYKEDGVSKTQYVKIPYYEGEQIKYYVDKGKGFVFSAEFFLEKGAELDYVLGKATDTQLEIPLEDE